MFSGFKVLIFRDVVLHSVCHSKKFFVRILGEVSQPGLTSISDSQIAIGHISRPLLHFKTPKSTVVDM